MKTKMGKVGIALITLAFMLLLCNCEKDKDKKYNWECITRFKSSPQFLQYVDKIYTNEYDNYTKDEIKVVDDSRNYTDFLTNKSDKNIPVGDTIMVVATNTCSIK